MVGADGVPVVMLHSVLERRQLSVVKDNAAEIDRLDLLCVCVCVCVCGTCGVGVNVQSELRRMRRNPQTIKTPISVAPFIQLSYRGITGSGRHNAWCPQESLCSQQVAPPGQHTPKAQTERHVSHNRKRKETKLEEGKNEPKYLTSSPETSSSTPCNASPSVS